MNHLAKLGLQRRDDGAGYRHLGRGLRHVQVRSQAGLAAGYGQFEDFLRRTQIISRDRQALLRAA